MIGYLLVWKRMLGQYFLCMQFYHTPTTSADKIEFLIHGSRCIWQTEFKKKQKKKTFRDWLKSSCRNRKYWTFKVERACKTFICLYVKSQIFFLYKVLKGIPFLKKMFPPLNWIAVRLIKRQQIAVVFAYVH